MIAIQKNSNKKQKSPGQDIKADKKLSTRTLQLLLWLIATRRTDAATTILHCYHSSKNSKGRPPPFVSNVAWKKRWSRPDETLLDRIHVYKRQFDVELQKFAQDKVDAELKVEQANANRGAKADENREVIKSMLNLKMEREAVMQESANWALSIKSSTKTYHAGTLDP